MIPSARFISISFSGIAVNGLGQAYPEVVNAIIEETKKLGHVSNVLLQRAQCQIGEACCARFPSPKKSFFCNSGTEAVEAALKLARKHHRQAGAG